MIELGQLRPQVDSLVTNCLSKSAQFDFFIRLLGILEQFFVEAQDNQEAVPLLVALDKQEFELTRLQSLNLLSLDNLTDRVNRQ